MAFFLRVIHSLQMVQGLTPAGDGAAASVKDSREFKLPGGVGMAQ